MIENPGKIDEEEKKGSSDNDDLSDEGFNDERDEDFERDANKQKLKVKAKKEISPSKKNLKQRFDETLSTVQEESEPENTF